jgi:hypothetical protein
MAKTKTERKPVALQPSRIRREPPRPERAVIPRSAEQELWFGVSGVTFVAVALGIIIIAIGAFTAYRAATKGPQTFAQCYSAGGADCVLDGDTIRIDRSAVEIAGILAPRIRGAACAKEKEAGIKAALGLSEILKKGKVTLGTPALDAQGREVRPVLVNDEDVGSKMISASLARPAGVTPAWCASTSQSG